MERLIASFAVGEQGHSDLNDYDLGILNGTIGIVSGIRDSGWNDQYIVDFDGDGRRRFKMTRF